MPGRLRKTFVWDVDGCFASAVTISRQGSDAQRWYVANVATHPDYRGRGLARALVTAALNRIPAQGGVTLYFMCAPTTNRRTGYIAARASSTWKPAQP